jgi:transposase
LLVLFWEGFELDSYESPDADTLLIRLEPDRSRPARCSSCGQPTFLIHDIRRRRVRERDLFHCRVWLEIPIRRALPRLRSPP